MEKSATRGGGGAGPTLNGKCHEKNRLLRDIFSYFE